MESILRNSNMHGVNINTTFVTEAIFDLTGVKIQRYFQIKIIWFYELKTWLLEKNIALYVHFQVKSFCFLQKNILSQKRYVADSSVSYCTSFSNWGNRDTDTLLYILPILLVTIERFIIFLLIIQKVFLISIMRSPILL